MTATSTRRSHRRPNSPPRVRIEIAGIEPVEDAPTCRRLPPSNRPPRQPAPSRSAAWSSTEPRRARATLCHGEVVWRCSHEARDDECVRRTCPRCSSPEDDIHSVENLCQRLRANAADSLGEQRTIERDDLRHVGDRVLRQSRRLRREQHVPRGTCPREIARQWHADDPGAATLDGGDCAYESNRVPAGQKRSRPDGAAGMLHGVLRP